MHGVQAGVEHCKEILPGLPPLPKELPLLTEAVRLLTVHRSAASRLR